MLTAKLIENNKFILVEGNPDELRQVRLSFTKKIKSWYIVKSKNPNVNVEETFMNAVGLIPVGLWVELINVCKKFGYQLVFYSDFERRVMDTDLTLEEFRDYANKLFALSNMTLRDYQIEGAYNMLHYKNCCVEISTSGGKTLISYLVFRYLKDVVGLKHILFVTPKTELTTQSAEKFIKYDRENGIDTDWTYSEIHAKAKKKDTYDNNIVFGNYQSLNKKKMEFFEKFDAVILDEAHHGQNTSCRTIIKKCNNVKYKIGMTGTFPMGEENEHDNFVLQAYIGPLVYRFTSYELINEAKFATPVHVNMIALSYLDDEKLRALYDLRNVNKRDDPTVGNKILNEEKIRARESRKRFSFIVNMISKVTKNTLVLFSDVQNDYGRNIYNSLRENTKKSVYYIDGGVDAGVRSKMIKAMEEDLGGDTIIVASIQCFSEGIDIANMWNIFLVETTKSENTLAQILGRGMRLFDGKDKTVMIDFIDDFRYGGGYFNENYLWKHGIHRMDVYKKRGFPCNMLEVDLNK